jgi:hypothetical protein
MGEMANDYEIFVRKNKGKSPLGRLQGNRLNVNWINPLKPKLVQIIFKNPVRATKKTPHFTITKIDWLTLFKEIIAVYSETHMNPRNTKCRVTDC